MSFMPNFPARFRSLTAATSLCAAALVTLSVGAATEVDAAGRRSLVTSGPYPGYVSENYSDPANWLCRPDKDDVCDHALDATLIAPDGSTRIERFRPARSPKIDCFYVYPTISTDPTGNSDFVPGEDQELFVVRQQAARLGAQCRVFAPVYRQATLTALTATLAGQSIPIDRELPYEDVADAWKHYIANDNQGRGVLLIGHSQGAGLLNQLIREEIDGRPELRARLVSAMILGSTVQVPAGKDVGGDFKNLPLCHTSSDLGCVISYASFRSTAPPPDNTYFGRAREEGWKAACTNPAALAGGRALLQAYFPTDAQTLPILPPTEPDWIDPALGVDITTPFVALPRLFSAECAETNDTVYLSIIVNADPDDARIDDTSGADLTPEWGLHLIDANVAMGNLVTIARNQARAYCANNGCAATPRAVRVPRG